MLREGLRTGAIEELNQIAASLDEDVSKQDRVILLAREAMQLGINKGSDIVAALSALGCNSRYVGMQLSALRGNDLARHYWRRDDDGTYRSLVDN